MAGAGEADVETEQTLYCLHMRLHHPDQQDHRIFSAIDLCRRKEIKAEETVVFGRDVSSCKFPLLNNKVSRLQFALQFFKPMQSSKMSFEIKNLSKRTKLYVNNHPLEYMNKFVLPPKCVICFGEFLIMVENEEGESEDKFEICCEVSRFPLVLEIETEVKVAIPETGTLNGSASSPFNKNALPPVEVDENDC
ncbi:TRAF-interacting protein with FHA domain-containing protein A [Pseudophryne corroboree]|uniref:TRAF-interacting protein with FHA domain-containing protein A n=1 Tax=Pseudophryne corroboree TaxID=495146 RepID=UPI00308215BA